MGLNEEGPGSGGGLGGSCVGREALELSSGGAYRSKGLGVGQSKTERGWAVRSHLGARGGLGREEKR